MAVPTQTSLKQNTITGIVKLKESEIGIPGLLVVLMDFDPSVTRDENLEPRVSGTQGAQNTTSAITGVRFGSVITDRNGSFSITNEDAEFRVANPQEKRPDLHLMVLGPEDTDKPPAVLFSSKLLRINAGRIESYIIRIPSQLLFNAEIAVPKVKKDDDNNVEEKVQKFAKRKAEKKDLRERIKKINKEFDDTEVEKKLEIRNTFRQGISHNTELTNSMYNFVKSTDTIDNVQKEVYKQGVIQINNMLSIEESADDIPVPGKGIKISLVLTDQAKVDLLEYKFTISDKDYYNIPETKLQELLFKREKDEGINSILFSNNPISRYCIQKSADQKCAEIHTDLRTEEEDNENESNGTEENNIEPTATTGITNDDIPVYLEKILASKNSDQFQTKDNNKSKRHDFKSVQSNVDNFALQKGPADTTAFYDFHSLQIAFQHVWQQLLDETIVNLGEQISTAQENSGEKTVFDIVKERRTATGAVNTGHKELAVATEQSIQQEIVDEVPGEIAMVFDISLLEYKALSHESKIIMDTLSKKINKLETTITERNEFVKTTHRIGDVNIELTVPTVINYMMPDNATLASVLRDQGERIIENIRMSKPFSTIQLLKELQERLLAKYEFTVFAANSTYHSVNFGLLNTYRQKWEPVSYQAGKLVKTIPLSPKEERKYSVKITRNTKVAKKEALKNNSTLQQEVNTTSRSESEIVAKANDKSNFNLSVKLDFSKVSTETGFSKNADKDSTQTKKDYHEATLKAAQEFKEERSLDIDTEETSGYEYNESGTVVNPNDELSVTYLFYELQRRFRVSEQLYRVMPVVMVAQEVPSPDQITEAWIIAHDWILNRVLLDDSFRSILQYLAQKNVGDVFAIRQFGINVKQQRKLLNDLQLEFAKLKQDVDNKYAAMEKAIAGRIDEEHDKRMYKYQWWWWYNQAERPIDRPDPEMAKALEQAATDEHKYAIEKAEKMALSVQREVNALHQLTKEYNTVMQAHLDRITQIRRLVTHIKANILYYMQAIWSMEPPDQRFMRLHHVNVPQFEAERTCIIQHDDISEEDVFAGFREDGKKKHLAWIQGELKRNEVTGEPIVTNKNLIEVADLDTLLGFKGNYMIFPLKEHNALTELMAAPYIDEAFGAMDPDQLSNINLEEFSRYICYLHREDEAEYTRLKPVLKEWLGRLLADPLRNGDEIIVPTGSLFIEMLPSDKTLLEDFKLKHREWDVYKVQAEVRKMELENIRYAARLLNTEREDPDIEKKIVVSGSGVGANLDVEN